MDAEADLAATCRERDKHGFCEIYENGQIRIEIAREDSQLKIVVFNNGKPIDREMMEKHVLPHH